MVSSNFQVLEFKHRLFRISKFKVNNQDKPHKIKPKKVKIISNKFQTIVFKHQLFKLIKFQLQKIYKLLKIKNLTIAFSKLQEVLIGLLFLKINCNLLISHK